MLFRSDASANPFRPAGSDPDPLAPFLAVGGLADAVHYKLGVGAILEELGLAAQAETCTAEIMELDRVVAEAYHRAGIRKFKARDLRSAIAFLSRAAEVLPGVPHYLNSLAGALYEAGELDLARRNLEQALRLRPDYPEAKENLELILQRRAGTQA